MPQLEQVPAGASVSGWPSRSEDAAVTVRIRAELVDAADGWSVRLMRELVCGESVLAGGAVWHRDYPQIDGAEDAYEALKSLGGRVAFWGSAALVLPSERLDAAVDAEIELIVLARTEAQRKKAKDEERRLAAEKRASEIVVYLSTDANRPWIELRRGRRAFCRLVLGAEWERDRVWDWLQWQRSRFQDFRVVADERGEDELKRMLLEEMLLTERAVKKRGLGAGGRRPLRFWRGDL